ncbi:isochorismatase family protein [Mesorhizobium sp. BAC0120]|uniref:isochorismatase family protein n=1 Tax=Mesorhizobium sp. BAC0120 TaxID=3090670 RepID=UPI00298CA7FD|nr:isochorismatase family protein [Mesorhizobium sp. BAC0120]MDW6023413.1 isochorismatase family protein [Mesorhizobium sp. BAC0120]
MYEQVRELYERSGFGGRVGFGERPAIVVIDLARSWLDDSSPQGSSRLEPVLFHTIKLLEAARTNGHPVFFTTMAFAAGEVSGPYGQKMIHLSRRGSLDAGSEMVALDPRLGRRPDEPLLVKPRASAFWGTPFDSYLVGRGVDTLIITGCSTSGCVRATAEGAHNLNLRTIVVREAVGDRSPLAHEVNLTDIDLRYADVVGIEETLSYLNEGATR